MFRSIQKSAMRGTGGKVNPLMMRTKLLLGCFMFALFGPVLAAPYSFQKLDVPGAYQTSAYGINDAGHIVGSYYDNPWPLHGFLFKNGQFSTLDFFPVASPRPTDFYTIAVGINANDNVVGTFNVSLGLSYGYLFDGKTYSVIQSPDFFVAEANGINATGAICGVFAYRDRPGLHGYLFSNGAFNIIDVPGSTTTKAHGLNDARHIVGEYRDSSGKSHGFLYREGRFHTIDYAGATSTAAYGINAKEEIVGTFTDATGIHGFVFAHGVFNKIDTPGTTKATRVLGINSAGTIVGDYEGTDGRKHGFLALDKIMLKSPFGR